MSSDYYAGINTHLLQQVPAAARKIFEVGCGYGNFGAQVKQLNPQVTYFGQEVHPEAARVAATKLDHVFCGNIESSMLVDDQFDCIIFGDVLEHLYQPLAVLRQVRAMLKPGGCVLCSVPNVQHHSVLASLLSGDFQYQDAGLLDQTHIRFFTYASFIKLLLNAGFVPEIADVIQSQPSPEFLEALSHGVKYLKQDQERFQYYLSAYQYIFKGTPNPDFDLADAPVFPISFIVPTNDRRQLGDNFACSPIFKGSHPHQLILLENQTSAAQAMETGMSRAQHDFVVYLHQDVYLPERWDAMFCRGVTEATQRVGHAGLYGVFGARCRNGASTQHGRVMDRHWSLDSRDAYPVEVDSIDELLIGFRKKEFPGADPALGYHLYGADLACSYREVGKATVVVNALCFHNSGLGCTLPPDFYDAIPYLSAKWRKYLPLAMPCGTIPSE
jgi:SAM-dependent methyltransferase